MDNWHLFLDINPEVNTLVLMYSESWIDEDYNPTGVREGYREEDGTIWTTNYDNTYDEWETYCYTLGDEARPTHWMYKPSPPKI